MWACVHRVLRVQLRPSSAGYRAVERRPPHEWGSTEPAVASPDSGPASSRMGPGWQGPAACTPVTTSGPLSRLSPRCGTAGVNNCAHS